MISETQRREAFRDTSERQQPRYRLAILDNDQLAFACLKDYLSSHDTPFELVFHAFNGMSAFDRIIDHPKEPLPDCILLAQPFDDFKVPFVCNRLRLATAGMPIMAMVTSESPYHAEELKRNGAQGIVEKTTPQYVFTALEEMMGQSTQAQAGFCPCETAHLKLQELSRGITKLPPRVEELMLKIVSKHCTLSQAAAEMNILPVTGRKYTRQLRLAFGINDTTAAIKAWSAQHLNLLREESQGIEAEQTSQASDQ